MENKKKTLYDKMFLFEKLEGDYSDKNIVFEKDVKEALKEFIDKLDIKLDDGHIGVKEELIQLAKEIFGDRLV